MTKEEIEQLIEAEVSKRVGTLTAQIGLDLEQRYATKKDLQDFAEVQRKDQEKALLVLIEDATRRLDNDEDFPEDHPFAFLVSTMEAISDLEIKMIEVMAYLLGEAKKPEDLDGILRFSHLKEFSRGRFRKYLREDLEHLGKSTSSDQQTSAYRQVIDLLTEEPQKN
jgi:hypothetical protein